jgi:hypothetical protein
VKGVGTVLLMIGACALAACEEPRPRDATAVPRLEIGAPGNAAAIVQLTDQQCVGRAAEPTDFQIALDISGWNFKKTQDADSENELSLDVWTSDTAQIIRGEVVKDHVFSCHLAIGNDFSPSDAEIRNAFAAKYGQPDKTGVLWDFKGQNGSRYKLDIGGMTEGPYGTSVFVEEWR